jgi:hypothetical protein
VTTALTQRVRLLQEENDELYELLKFSETGKLKEEVRGLRRVVERVEGALRGTYALFSEHFLGISYAGYFWHSRVSTSDTISIVRVPKILSQAKAA